MTRQPGREAFMDAWRRYAAIRDEATAGLGRRASTMGRRFASRLTGASRRWLIRPAAADDGPLYREARYFIVVNSAPATLLARLG